MQMHQMSPLCCCEGRDGEEPSIKASVCVCISDGEGQGEGTEREGEACVCYYIFNFYMTALLFLGDFMYDV